VVAFAVLGTIIGIAPPVAAGEIDAASCWFKLIVVLPAGSDVSTRW